MGEDDFSLEELGAIDELIDRLLRYFKLSRDRDIDWTVERMEFIKGKFLERRKKMEAELLKKFTGEVSDG